MSQKIGLVLEGGGMRGIFTAGVLDYLIDKNVYFDYVVGVSAGAGNAVGFVARQKGRTKRIIMHDNAPTYFGLRSLVRTGKILNLKTLVTRYAEKEIPFDFDAFMNSKTDCEVVAVNCESGDAEYIDVKREKDLFYRANIASCSVPFVCKPMEIGDYHYLDGSISDSIPIKRAIEDMGCDKVVVIMTKPEGKGPTDYGKHPRRVRLFYGKYPNLCNALFRRVDDYDEQKRYMDQLVKEGRALVLRPEETLMHHFELKSTKLEEVYQYAYQFMKDRYLEFDKFIKE